MVLSPDEVLSTLILVIPGFVALAIARYSWGTSRSLETFSLTVWSIFLSAVIDFVFLSVSGLKLPPSANELVLALSTSVGLAEYSLMTLSTGLIGGLLLRFEVPRLLRRLVWVKAPSVLAPSLVWDDALSVHQYQSIVAELDGGLSVQGYLERFSTFEEPREVVLSEPRRVVYAKDGQPRYYEMGNSIFIPEKQILSLRFLSPPTSGAKPRLRKRFRQWLRSRSRSGPRAGR